MSEDDAQSRLDLQYGLSVATELREIAKLVASALECADEGRFNSTRSVSSGVKAKLKVDAQKEGCSTVVCWRRGSLL